MSYPPMKCPTCGSLMLSLCDHHYGDVIKDEGTNPPANVFYWPVCWPCYFRGGAELKEATQNGSYTEPSWMTAKWYGL